MAAPITFTLDLEDHRPDHSWPFRVPEVTRRVLELLDDLRVVGTFFVVGELAERVPELVREVAGAGHELGLHAYRHVPLPDVEPDVLGEELRRGKELLEDLAGKPVVGFRAPTFSLVPESAWAVDLLAELSFEYSSSVLPAPNPLFGWPGAPRRPFRWSNGVVELPAPTAGLGRFRIPFLGGVYFRVLPAALVRLAAVWDDPGPCPWLYCHPYDFDPEEPFWVVPDAGPWGSRLLWLNRRKEFSKVRRLFDRDVGPPLLDRARRLAPDLPVVDPGDLR